MCEKASHIFIFLNPICLTRIVKYSALKKKEIGKEKSPFSIQIFIHVNMERRRAANRYTYTHSLN